MMCPPHSQDLNWWQEVEVPVLRPLVKMQATSLSTDANKHKNIMPTIEIFSGQNWPQNEGFRFFHHSHV